MGSIKNHCYRKEQNDARLCNSSFRQRHDQTDPDFWATEAAFLAVLLTFNC
jgi:hypothetical protein